jgi:dihydroorotate dehydrogenase electron transfer subunit
MSVNCKSKKAVFVSEVVSNKLFRPRIGRLKLGLDWEGSKAFLSVIPGQFMTIDLSNASLPNAEDIPPALYDKSKRQLILRRPFSFCDVDTSSSTVTVEVLYTVLGPATLRMMSLRAGDKLSVIGPLGNGFLLPDNFKNVILVSGGLGAPPIQHMAKFIKRNYPKIKITAFIGAKRMDDFPFLVGADNSITEFDSHDIETAVTTDDGSLGYKGFVTDCLVQYIEKRSPDAEDTIIYSCGPEPMLAAVSKLAGRYRIPCQVSMERMMACGIGLCQSCAVETHPAQVEDEINYKLCCKEGPVFDSREVIFK